jgi:hypothetical protein
VFVVHSNDNTTRKSDFLPITHSLPFNDYLLDQETSDLLLDFGFHRLASHLMVVWERRLSFNRELQLDSNFTNQKFEGKFQQHPLVFYPARSRLGGPTLVVAIYHSPLAVTGGGGKLSEALTNLK